MEVQHYELCASAISSEPYCRISPGIGGLIVLLLKKVSDRIVSVSMGFASGVMLMVAFNNLFLEAEKFITHACMQESE